MLNGHDLRRQALQQIGLLTASSESQQRQYEIKKLSAAILPAKGLQNGTAHGPKTQPPSLASTPMTSSELDVLLALSKTAPFLDDLASAKRLVTQLSPYLAEAHAQSLAPSPFLRSIEPSPWESLTYQLTSATLAIGITHPSLHDIALNSTNEYLQSCLRAINAGPVVHYEQDISVDELPVRERLGIATTTVSLLGFLEAASLHIHFYSVSERLKLIGLLQRVLTEGFMVSIEGVFSSIRTADIGAKRFSLWKLWTRRYAASGRPLGAMLLQCGYMKLLVSCSAMQIATAQQLREQYMFDLMIQQDGSGALEYHNQDPTLLEILSDAAVEEMRLLEDGADYLQLGSAWQQRLAFAVKAHTLNTYLNCLVASEDIADSDTLISWLDDTIADPVQMADDTLASVVLRSMAVVAKLFPAMASSLSRSLPKFIVQGGIKGSTVTTAAQTLAYILKLLSPDAVITGLYSLGNVLSAISNGDKTAAASGIPDRVVSNARQDGRLSQHSSGSAISLDISSDDESGAAYGNIVRAIVSIATCCQDEKITALAQSMLLQKLGKVSLSVDIHIITEAAVLAQTGGQSELNSLLKLYARISHEGAIQSNSTLLGAVMRARLYLAKALMPASTLFEVYLTHLLELIVSKGDVHESDKTLQGDVDLAAREIIELLPPLAILVSVLKDDSYLCQDVKIRHLYREAWFNIIVHGISSKSGVGQQHANELRIFAVHSPPLVAEDRTEQFESEIELNTVLRRGMNPPHIAEQKARLISILARCESDIRSLSYPKVIFLSAAYLVEVLRADAGECSQILPYFLDPSFNGSAMENCMVAIAEEVMNVYLYNMLRGNHNVNAAPQAAKQLAMMFTGCCHRMFRVQQIAASCADKIIGRMPSSLCQKSSLFALLELLTIMWTSCLDGELDEYDWKSSYTSARGNVSVNLSDNYSLRKATLNTFYKRAKLWVMVVINIAPLDVKGLLQTYLSEYDDHGAYGHVALGRSFALELGATIPATDHKLGAIDRHSDCNINTASDFIAQYSTRQGYRYTDVSPENMKSSIGHRQEERNGASTALRLSHTESDQDALARLARRAEQKDVISDVDLRDILRRAAALLCKAGTNQCGVVRHLVGIPFTIFTKQSIQLGIALWLGVMNENPLMEPRILTEISQSWEATVHNSVGVFSDKLNHPDPFYVKEEFAPSDKHSLSRKQQAAHDLIAPHLRILQFLNSHFNATRLGSPQVQKIFHRMISITLQGIQQSTGHPLAREFHFQVTLLSLNVLRYSVSLDAVARWKLKDAILSAGLRWFAHQPRWSFGGNRLQIKAETQLLADVNKALRVSLQVGSKAEGNLQNLQAREDLLHALLENEQMRLVVWLYPLDHERRHLFASQSGKTSQELSGSLVATAWMEHPSVAIHLETRFPSLQLQRDVRGLLLDYPEKAVSEPDSLRLLVGPSLPLDLSSQLKYLLYWAPVNPITAVTYFLPEYGNHPFILQYAMRALESHPVDVTFFYVPQIVQALRYDALGYVQRYIIETAKFSQLFAHQIIWNMTANAYKDEDSSIEDSLKPTLDVVTNNMITSFSRADKAFYEREFAFFNEITDISGKLRPYIKKSKPEKKQKIEEELRKIKVEVGVYLPSNPDGTVVGIDRKSGKPLQSHAKAPYMATFRIKKTRGDMEATDGMPVKTNQNVETGRNQLVSQESTFEVWQSAIFKVGDDCRQDVLALQLIAAFRGIFNNVGLDVYVYPYRVTATAPGCGVIDVLPNSISRDMLGREAVNGLYDYFISKYGPEDSIRFQQARNNFVKSMAAYSVISYLLQFKDRHNGNIMIDDAGHILHIDFGFCFDIAPGGVRFERAPFKLTTEMVAVMGGSTTSQSYRWFEELCVKSFLASRQHTDKLCHIVVLMLGSGLPCFKPETIAHLRQRFVLDKSEREAADFMKDLVKKSYGNYSTKGYDQFQLLTNGIPY